MFPQAASTNSRTLSGSSQAGGALWPGGTRPERLVDTFIYSVRLDPGGLTLIGRDQLDTLVRPLGDGDLACDLADTPDGNRRVRVGRLHFTRPSG